MNKAIDALADVANEWATSGSIAEVDWNRMRVLEFQESIRARDALVAKLPSHACLLCSDFKDHVSLNNNLTCHGILKVLTVI